MNIRLQLFNEASAQVARDGDFRDFIQGGLRDYAGVRASTESRYGDWSAAREAASAIKWEAIENLDALLKDFTEKLEARGTKICWARDSEEARRYILEVMRKHDARSIIKSKCMTSEEIRLNDLLEAEAFEVVESDLGEYIVQMRKEPPYHIVAPAMHLKRDRISALFQEKLNAKATEDPAQLTQVARHALRRKYVEADVGFSGANFGIAETGMISITENEGNARLCTSLPRVHIALMGIEKVIPRLDDLAILLPMLATAGTGQLLTCYNSMIGGPRQPGEMDGPEELHLVLLDNQRTRLLADPELRDALRCIRCGACLNVCPVFNNVGGHSYGTTYQGPIGSVITPPLRGVPEWNHLSHASSLCGACTETCPVGIDLHHHLLRNRLQGVRTQRSPINRFVFSLFATVMKRPWLYWLAGRAARVLHGLAGPLQRTRLDPLLSWRMTRGFPEPARETFKDYWRKRKKRIRLGGTSTTP